MLGWCSLIFWLSNQSDLPDPEFPLPPHADKIVHAALYAILAALSYPLARSLGLRRTGAAIAAMLFASLYGASDEWHQSFVGGRDADVMDWVADTLGAMTVTWIAFREDKLLALLARGNRLA